MGYSAARLIGLKQHWTSKHGKMVPKREFKTLQEALDCIFKHHINSDKYHPYVCSECGQWHIGHNRTKKRRRSAKNSNT
jgi:hypothetical protein